MQAIHPLVDFLGMAVEQLQEPKKNLSVGSMDPINVFEFLHFREGQAKVFQAGNESQAFNVILGVNAFSPFDAFHRIEKSDLLIVSNGSRTHAHKVRKLSNLVSLSQGSHLCGLALNHLT
jgi:hypothetical protein